MNLWVDASKVEHLFLICCRMCHSNWHSAVKENACLCIGFTGNTSSAITAHLLKQHIQLMLMQSSRSFTRCQYDKSKDVNQSCLPFRCHCHQPSQFDILSAEPVSTHPQTSMSNDRSDTFKLQLHMPY